MQDKKGTAPANSKQARKHSIGIVAVVIVLLVILNRVAASENDPATLSLVVDSAELIVSRDQIQRIALARTDIIEARLMNERELLILALQVGEVDLWWWTNKGVRHTQRVRVVARQDRQLERQVRAILSSRERDQSELSELGVVTSQWDDGYLFLRGEVSAHELAQFTELKQQHSQLDLHGLYYTPEIAEVIELEVQVYEVSTRWLQQLGLRWQQTAAGPVFGVLADGVGGDIWRVESAMDLNLVPGDSDLLQELGRGQRSYLGWMASLRSVLQLVQERGAGKVLATPRLRVESGTQATFLAGGEIPVPQTNALGQTEVTFKNYGVQLHVLPELLADQQIRTHLISELSHPDLSVAVQGVPGLRSRRTETTVTVADGETLVVAGLISYEESSTRSGLPGAMSGPGTGSNLLSAEDYSQQHTEVVVFVTPRNVSRVQRQQKLQREQQQEFMSLFQTLGCTGMEER
ncbi:MAG: pilus assembly protein N-terminal domain-containing protein [Gammaproteobacteria bacterium]|nr:pilus assembly protein N-terminal domain-containing protein [Gammaproteobacteria bacterium]